MDASAPEDRYPPRQRRVSRAETRRRILEAAARVFARQGLAAASLDEVAAAAGFSKGAVYSNFASKDELVLALMEQEIGARVERVGEAIAAEPTLEGRSREAGRTLTEALHEDIDWQLLFFEFWLRAIRDPELRAQFAARRAPLRAPITRLIGELAADAGLALPVPAERLAVAVLALANGLAVEGLADPAAVPPDTFGLLLTLLFRGLVASADEGPGDWPADGR